MVEAELGFGDRCRESGIVRVAMFGDSITAGAAASTPERTWTALFAAATATRAVDCAISGTVLQSSCDADGVPRPDNGLMRCRRDLLNGPAGALCILYGYNDARYTWAPDTFNLAGFVRDYRKLIGVLFAGGYAPDTVAVGSPPYIPDVGFDVGSPGFTGQTRTGFEDHVTAVRQVAAEFGLAYAPVYETMAEKPDGSLASPDITHPNDAGHALIARAFLDAVRVR